MPNNNSDNQAKIDREQSVFEVQRADLKRNLEKALDKCWEYASKDDIADARIAIIDALSVLENMEEGEAITVDSIRPLEPPIAFDQICPRCGIAFRDHPIRCKEPPAEEPEKKVPNPTHRWMTHNIESEQSRYNYKADEEPEKEGK